MKAKLYYRRRYDWTKMKIGVKPDNEGFDDNLQLAVLCNKKKSLK